MGLLGHENFESMKELFVHQLEDVYDAEKRILDILPRIKDVSMNSQLQSMLTQHPEQVQQHRERLEQVFEALGHNPSRETCPAMRGLIQEAEEMVKAEGDDVVRDMALVASLQRIAHYKMAAYGTLRALARHMGLQDATNQMDKNHREIDDVDKKLTELADSQLVAA